MMIKKQKQAGFTAVELLVTLFVAAAFLIAAYQLFNLIIKDGGSTRSESRAANVAYDYLRQYAASSTTIPCTPSSPLTDAPLTVDGLTDVTIDVTVSCLPNAISSLSKVEVAVSYNNPVQTIKYSTYTSSTGANSLTEVTNGLVAWWKLNGNTNNSIGSPNGVASNITSTIGQGSVANTAYSFNGSNSVINTSSTFGLGTNNVSLSVWVYNPSSSNKGIFAHVGSTGYGIGIGNTTTDVVGTKIVMIFNSVRWIPTSTNLGTGWHHVVMVINASGVPSAYLDGTSIGSFAGANALPPSPSITTIGTITSAPANTFTGTIDDVRLYNRALSATDVQTLYANGAQ